jgi:hypothetical protein
LHEPAAQDAARIGKVKSKKEKVKRRERKAGGNCSFALLLVTFYFLL